MYLCENGKKRPTAIDSHPPILHLPIHPRPTSCSLTIFALLSAVRLIIIITTCKSLDYEQYSKSANNTIRTEMEITTAGSGRVGCGDGWVGRSENVGWFIRNQWLLWRHIVWTNYWELLDLVRLWVASNIILCVGGREPFIHSTILANYIMCDTWYIYIGGQYLSREEELSEQFKRITHLQSNAQCQF